MKNYYDILEVSRKASKDTINKVFKMHMKANHPDLFQGEEKTKAEEKSKELTEAYNILSDDAERAKYDAELDLQNDDKLQLRTVMEENEYLKQVIAKKDEIIGRLTGNYQSSTEPSNTLNNEYDQFGNPINTENNTYHPGGGFGFNGFSPNDPTNPYAGMSYEDLKKIKKEEKKRYYLALLKEYGVKLAILLAIIIVMLISIVSSSRNVGNILKH